MAANTKTVLIERNDKPELIETRFSRKAEYIFILCNSISLCSVVLKLECHILIHLGLLASL